MTNRTSRITRIKKLSSDPKAFMQELGSCPDDFKGSAEAILDIIENAEPPTLKYNELKHFISVALVEQLHQVFNSPPTNYWGTLMKLNSFYVDVIEKCTPYLLNGTKSAVVDLVLSNYNLFNSSVKNRLIRSCCKLIPSNDARGVLLFKRFYRSMDKKNFNELVKKIPGGIDNPEIKKIVKKSKFFTYLRYDKDYDLSDLGKRKRLIKDLAKSPTLCKKLPFTVSITKKDLEELPSVTRFEFIEYLYKYKMHYTKYWTHMGYESLVGRIALAERERNVSADNISMEDMKSILFSLMIHKNVRVNKWLDEYKNYLDRIEALSKGR